MRDRIRETGVGRGNKEKMKEKEKSCHNQLSSIYLFYRRFYLGHVKLHCPHQACIGGTVAGSVGSGSRNARNDLELNPASWPGPATAAAAAAEALSLHGAARRCMRHA